MPFLFTYLVFIMGMIASFLKVSESELNLILDDSSILETKIYNEEENSDLIDIDKAWDGILFLLTGNGFSNLDGDLSRVIFSEEFVDIQQDLGYGPAHYLTPTEVKELSSRISEITIEDLKKSYDSSKMMELDIYPQVWDDEESSFEYLSEYFLELQLFYKIASAKDEAIITILS